MTKSEWCRLADDVLDRLLPEFGTDTTRALLEVFIHGARRRYLDLMILATWAAAKVPADHRGDRQASTFAPIDATKMHYARFFVKAVAIRQLQVKDTLSIQETARLLGYTDDHIRRLIRQGRLKTTATWPRRCLEESVSNYWVKNASTYAYQERRS